MFKKTFSPFFQSPPMRSTPFLNVSKNSFLKDLQTLHAILDKSASRNEKILVNSEKAKNLQELFPEIKDLNIRIKDHNEQVTSTIINCFPK